MGRLIIDGNSVFEIDEECLRRRTPPQDCDVERYIHQDKKEYKEVFPDKSNRNRN